MKTCVTCRHHESASGTSFCRAPQNSYIHLVSGENKPVAAECWDQRYMNPEDARRCGRDGKWWVSVETEQEAA